MSTRKQPRERSPSIAIIGAGLGGLSFAIALKRQLGFENFTIFEKASDVGGTWRDNIYPGCSSDVFIHFFSLSTDLKPDWDSTIGSQPEICAYWKELSQKYSLYPHIVFNSKVISAEWDDAEQLYNIVTEDVLSGAQTTTAAQILVSAIGILEVPKFPAIQGISTFKGETFHSGRWDNGVELPGKRVAVIGNGASAAQFVPIITQDPSVQVTEFCRTPAWLLPPIRAPVSPTRKWVLTNVPFAMKLHRLGLYVATEMIYLIFSSRFIRGLATKYLTKYILKTSPPEYHDKLIPSYPLGCKRMLVDTDFLPALHRPNLKLNWDGIAEIVEDGIVTKKGEKLPFDTMIFSTGYTTDQYPISVRGNNGQTIQDYYESQQGPKAYLGTTVPGFPNFYLISGPNTTSGHTSVLFTTEIQNDYYIQLIKPIIEGRARSFDVTPEATDAYNDKLAPRLARSVFMGCTSWYRVGGNGKISNVLPVPGTLYWWWLRRPTWSHYKGVGDERWIRHRRLAVVKRLILSIIGLVILGSCVRRAEPIRRGAMKLLDSLYGNWKGFRDIWESFQMRHLGLLR